VGDKQDKIMKIKERLIARYTQYISNLQTYVDCYGHDENMKLEVENVRGQIEAYQNVIKQLSNLK